MYGGWFDGRGGRGGVGAVSPSCSAPIQSGSLPLGFLGLLGRFPQEPSQARHWS